MNDIVRNIMEIMEVEEEEAKDLLEAYLEVTWASESRELKGLLTELQEQIS